MASSSKPKLTPEEIAAPFSGTLGDRLPSTLSRKQVAELLGVSVKTIDDWKAKGRLDGTYRKRGKHLFFWRSRVLNLIYNGKEWN
jgi:hypothetical protein